MLYWVEMDLTAYVAIAAVVFTDPDYNRFAPDIDIGGMYRNRQSLACYNLRQPHIRPRN